MRIGDIVHYVAADFGGPKDGPLCVPAIVTKVIDETTVNLQAIPDGLDTLKIMNQNLGNPNAMLWQKGVSYTENKRRATWHHTDFHA